MKNNVLKTSLIFVVLVIISLVFSFIIYNKDVLFLNKNERKIIDLSLNESKYTGFNHSNDFLSSDGDLNEISFDYKGYINKLVIEYETDNNFSFVLNYNSKNYFNNSYNKTINESFTTKLNKSYTVFKDKVDGFNIKFEGNNSFVIKSIKVDNTLSFNRFLFIFIFASIGVVTILYLYFKNNLFSGKIEKLFLSIVFIIGGLFILLQPHTTSFSWDDQIHFSSIYRIFELDGLTEWKESYHTMTEIAPFSDSINTVEERNLQNDYLESNNKVVKTESNSRLISYNQIGYIVPGFVLKICSMIGISTVVTVILTKFSMLSVYGIIMYFAIKVSPYGKRIIAIFGLIPTVLFLSTQFSYDPPIIASMCLFVAEFLSVMCNKKKKIDLKVCLILLISIIVASFIKAVYIPLILLCLLIPKDNFLNDKQRKNFKIGVILIFIMIVITFVVPAVTTSDAIGDFRGGNTNSSEQLHMILKNPLGYANLLKDTAGALLADRTISSFALYNYSYVKNVLNTPSYTNIYFIILLLLVFVILTDSYNDKKIKNEKLIKIFNCFIIIGIIILIWTALYIAFTPVGEMTINGVQSRYFLPLIIPFVLINLSNNKIKSDYNIITYDSVIMGIMSLTLLYSLYVVYFNSFCM